MRLFILFFSIWLLNINSYCQITHHITYDRNKLLIDSVEINDSRFIKMSYDDYTIKDTVGAPDLPYKILRFIVPNGSHTFNISTKSTMIDSIYLPTTLYPVDKEIPIGYYSSSHQEGIDANYQSEVYPKEIVEIIGEGYLDGDIRILSIKITPTQFMPSCNKLLFHSNITFSINSVSQQLKAVSQAIKPIESIRERNINELSMLLNNIENKAEIGSYVKSKNSSIRTKSMSLPAYEYVVITADSLIESFDPLINWKQQKGINAGVVSIESILNDPTITKDEISNIADEAGRLRHYLRLAYTNGTKYVLLGGGSPIVPIRYGTGDDNNWALGEKLIYKKIPTDLYFSELNGNWNYDGDKYYGEEYGDKIEYHHDLIVGRILCKNRVEVNNYITKLLIYEQNPGKGDSDYLQRALYTQADEMQGRNQAKVIADSLSIYFPNYNIISELPDHYGTNTIYPLGKDIIDAVNNNNPGFISFFNHGGPNAIVVKSDGMGNTKYNHYPLIATEGENINEYLVIDNNNSLDKLTNLNKPAILYTISCTVMPYDIYFENDRVYDVKYTLGERFTIADKYGAVAFLGNTRSGWVTSSFDLQKAFISELKKNEGKIGLSEALSKTQDENHWLALTHNLLGCPEFQMWTKAPNKFDNVSNSQTNNTHSINTHIMNSNIVLKGLFGDNRIEMHNGDNYTFNNIPNNYVITLNKHNYLPYIIPIKLQNESVTGKHYIDASSLEMGNAVDANKTKGEFVLTTQSNLNIVFSDEVILDCGTTIEQGAELNISPKH